MSFLLLGFSQIQVPVAVAFESRMLARQGRGSPLKVNHSETGGGLIRSLETLMSWTVQIANDNEEPHRAMADSLTGRECRSVQPAEEKSLSRLLPPIPTSHKCISVSFDFAQFSV